jgi:hypothetical protein
MISVKRKEQLAAAGSKGGMAAAKKRKRTLTKDERSARARETVNARWAKLRAAGKIGATPLRPVETRKRKAKSKS